MKSILTIYLLIQTSFCFSQNYLINAIKDVDVANCITVKFYNNCDSITFVEITWGNILYQKLKVKPYDTVTIKLPTFRSYYILSKTNYYKNKSLPKFQTNGLKIKDSPGLIYFFYNSNTDFLISLNCPENV